jgi:hypothetical protein
MERQFGPFKKGDLVRFRHQEGHKALGVVVETVYYPESRVHSFCWVAWNFLNGERGRNPWKHLERVA